MYEVIKSLVDDGKYYEPQKAYATNMITCFARMAGSTIGIIANQPRVMAGCLDINASDKAARFIRFCDAFNIPLLNIVDVPGFLPGTNQEFGGIIRHGAKMLYAYCEASVPKITLVTRKAYGGAYLAMCSQDLGADLVVAWPTAEIAVMGPAGAAKIIFRKEPDVEKKTNEYIKEFSTPYYAAKHGMVDMIIEPKTTRPVIINALHSFKDKKESLPTKKHGNIPL
jgi:acetyl-CoA carboxylase carboxyltransferase component